MPIMFSTMSWSNMLLSYRQRRRGKSAMVSVLCRTDHQALSIHAASTVHARSVDKDNIGSHFSNALKSVATHSPANLAEAINSAKDCYTTALQQKNQADALRYQCVSTKSITALQVHSKSHIQSNCSYFGQNAYLAGTNQFVGYLPPNVLNGIIDGLFPYLRIKRSLTVSLAIEGNKHFKSKSQSPNEARTHLNNVFKSVGASTSGESATLFISLTLCLNNLLMESRPVGAIDCLTKVSQNLGRVALADGLIGSRSYYRYH